jgi:hypothetical protein
LARLLNHQNERQCYVKQSENHIGYIVKLNTIKSAKDLIEQWHNKEIEGGHILKCQLELNIFPSTSKAWSDLLATVNKRKKESSAGSATSSIDSKRKCTLLIDY